MTKMNETRLIGIALTLFAGSVFAGAQTAGPAGGAPAAPHLGGHHNGLKVEREVLAKLDLNASQRDQIKAALTTLTSSVKSLRQAEKASDNKDDRREKYKALHKTYMESLKTILTPAQFAQYRALHREMRKKVTEPKV